MEHMNKEYTQRGYRGLKKGAGALHRRHLPVYLVAHLSPRVKAGG